MSTALAALNNIGFGTANALALMVFCLLYVPCTATIATIRRETESRKLTILFVLFQLCVAWIMSFLFYHIFLLIG